MQNFNYLLTLAIFAFVGAADEANKIINCYFGSWAVVQESSQFKLESLNANFCTHLSCVNFDVASNGSLDALNNPNDANIVASKRAMTLKRKSSYLKSIIAVVGGPKTNFINIAVDEIKREIFIFSVLTLLIEYGFDGVDLFWPNVGRYDGDAYLLNTLLSNLGNAVKAFNFSLSISLKGELKDMQQWSKITDLWKEVDYVNVMAFNYTDTFYHAPFHKDKENSVQETMKYLLQNKSAPASKLLLGVAFFSNGYIVKKKERSSGKNVVKLYQSAPYRQISYNGLCSLLEETEFWYQKHLEATYIKYGGIFESFESPMTLAVKTDYVYELGLGGIAVWLLEHDDFVGGCGQSYPLMRLIHERMSCELDYDG